jgi:lipid II:glycine glycyltransferase (peptidoglycan interpeptide bridge formation enzyme)
MALSPDWDAFVAAHPHGHLLQTAAWGDLKAAFGWRAQPVLAGEAGALVLFKPLPLGFSIGYVPRGPLADWNDEAGLAALVRGLDAACRVNRAVLLKLEPDLPESPAASAALRRVGLRPSAHTVQPRRTLVLDLAGSEADVLARMKPKTRYNIGLAARKGVTARPAQGPADLDAFAGLLAATSARDKFAVHAPAYYRRAYDLFNPAGRCELFLAEYQGQPLAGVTAFVHGCQAWYLYGASSDAERPRMAPYLAQWEAMRWARARGATSYDLWGVPDAPEAELEATFEQRSGGLWGVYRFKRGFGGRLVRTIGAWDRVYNPLLYRAYLVYLNLRGANLG